MIVRQWLERARASLFTTPFLYSLLAVALAEAVLVADRRVGDLPARLTATVDSARAVLSVIASATLTFAGIAFSVSLLLVSAASSQFSPRVVHGLFRDPFNKQVMGVVIGTFVYCLVVMRAVRAPLQEGGEATIPSLSVLVAVVLGLLAILATVAFINHSAHTMEVSTLLHRVTGEARESARRVGHGQDPERPGGDVAPSAPLAEPLVVPFETDGWVQHVDHAALLDAIPPRSHLRVETIAGHYAVPGVPLARLWPRPDQDVADRVADRVRRAVVVGASRTLQQDVHYGIRQLADVALKALSPGINDPTTAQDAIFHMVAVVREVLVSGPGRRWYDGDEGRYLEVPDARTPAETVALAFDEVRLASVGQPTVLVYLLEALALLTEVFDDDHPGVRDALEQQAALVVEVAALGDLPEADRQRVRAAHRRRFTEA